MALDRLRDRGLIAAFALAIAAPSALAPLPHLVGRGFVPDTAAQVERVELRVPAPWPRVSARAADLRALPARLDAWFEDRFAFRGRMIAAHSALSLLALGVSPSPKFLCGRDGWVFRADPGVIANARALDPFDVGELEAWRRHLEWKRDWLAVRGIRYAFLLAPQKSTVYPEKLPDWMEPVAEVSRIEQFYAHMCAHSDVVVVDVRPALWRQKAREPVYFPLGSHWNDLGAHTAYVELVRAVAPWFAGLRPTPRSEFRRRQGRGQGDRLTSRLYLGTWQRQ